MHIFYKFQYILCRFHYVLPRRFGYVYSTVYMFYLIINALALQAARIRMLARVPKVVITIRSIAVAHHGVALLARSKRAAGATSRPRVRSTTPARRACRSLSDSRTLALYRVSASASCFMTTGFHICLAIALALGLYTCMLASIFEPYR